MRLFPAIALSAVLLAAAPAHAQITDDMGSEQQTSGYLRMFAYLGAVAVALITALVVGHVIRGMVAEAKRGKKSIIAEDILDDDDVKPKRDLIPLYLGEKVPDWKIANRLKATAAGLAYVAKTDPAFDPNKLPGLVEKAFRGVKEAIEGRSVKVLERLVGPACLEELEADIRKLKKKREVRVFGSLEITDVQVVHFEAPAGPATHVFTALVSAESKDYYADAETGKRVRGDKKTYMYQEFWRFRRAKDKWLVERIRQSGDMDMVLEAKNMLSREALDAFAKKADPAYLREFTVKKAPGEI